MRIMQDTQARRDALRLVTDPQAADTAGRSLRQIAWNILVSQRGGFVRTMRPDNGRGDAA